MLKVVAKQALEKFRLRFGLRTVLLVAPAVAVACWWYKAPELTAERFLRLIQAGELKAAEEMAGEGMSVGFLARRVGVRGTAYESWLNEMAPGFLVQPISVEPGNMILNPPQFRTPSIREAVEGRRRFVIHGVEDGKWQSFGAFEAYRGRIRELNLTLPPRPRAPPVGGPLSKMTTTTPVTVIYTPRLRSVDYVMKELSKQYSDFPWTISRKGDSIMVRSHLVDADLLLRSIDVAPETEAEPEP